MKKAYGYALLIAVILAAIWLTQIKREESVIKLRSTPQLSETHVALSTNPSVEGKEGHSATGVHIAYRTPKPIDLPSGRLGLRLSNLEARAYAGNTAVAYSLAMGLFDCYVNTKNEKLQSASAADGAADKCQGLTDDDYNQAIKLLAYAAKNGNVNAQNAYMGEVGLWMRMNPQLKYQPGFMEAYVQDSLNYTQSAAMSGNVDAMVQMAQIYDAGVITKRNATLAYAYMYASNKTGLIPSAQRMLTYWQSKLAPKEISDGASEGEQIYQQCCSRR